MDGNENKSLTSLVGVLLLLHDIHFYCCNSMAENYQRPFVERVTLFFIHFSTLRFCPTAFCHCRAFEFEHTVNANATRRQSKFSFILTVSLFFLCFIHFISFRASGSGCWSILYGGECSARCRLDI